MKFSEKLAPLEPALAGIKFVGPEQGEHFSAPGRIAWSPTAASYTAPKRLGAAEAPGTLWTREVSFDFEIWGEDIDDAEQMLTALLRALWATYSGHGHTVRSERWITGNAATNGAICVLTAVLGLPVVREAPFTRKLTEIETTYEMDTTP